VLVGADFDVGDDVGRAHRLLLDEGGVDGAGHFGQRRLVDAAAAEGAGRDGEADAGDEEEEAGDGAGE